MWDVLLVTEVEEWFLDLCEEDPHSADLVADAIDLLAEIGPTLRRPAVDTLKGSRYHHLKELRPGSAGGSEIRLIFAFDPRRQAIILVAGDKAGIWHEWYDKAIPVAERRYEEHCASLGTQDDPSEDHQGARGRRTKRRHTKEGR